MPDVPQAARIEVLQEYALTAPILSMVAACNVIREWTDKPLVKANPATRAQIATLRTNLDYTGMIGTRNHADALIAELTTTPALLG